MPDLIITVKGMDSVIAKLRDGGSPLLARPLTDAMTGTLLEGERIAKEKAPHWRNVLRNSMTHELIGKPVPLLGRVGVMRGPATPYARVMEYGRRAGAKQPPISAIEPWAKSKGIPAFLVARSIARKGIKGRYYMKATREALVPIAQRRFTAAARQIEALWGSR